MARVLLALSRRLEDRIIVELLGAGHEVIGRVQTSAEIIALVSRERPEAALVSVSQDRLTRELVEACDDTGTRLVPVVSGDAERRMVAGLGLLELVDEAAPWSEFEAAIGGAMPIAATPAAPSGAGASGEVVAVWGSAGAPGRTTVAINLAAEIAATGRTVVLVDADCYGGTVAPALGLLDESPGFAAACRLAGMDGLTRRELERVAQWHGGTDSVLRVLTGIARADRWPELGEDRVRKTIAACRAWADYVVVDTASCIETDEEISSDLFAPRRNAATNAVLDAADRIVVVGRADPVGVTRLLRAHSELIERGHLRSDVVLNRVRASATGMAPKAQLTAALSRFGGIEPCAMLPDDAGAVDAAVLVGATLREVAPRSPLRQAILGLATGSILPRPQASSRRAARSARGRRVAVHATG